MVLTSTIINKVERNNILPTLKKKTRKIKTWNLPPQLDYSRSQALVMTTFKKQVFNNYTTFVLKASIPRLLGTKR